MQRAAQCCFKLNCPDEAGTRVRVLRLAQLWLYVADVTGVTKTTELSPNTPVQ